jgi:hypothetical protein
MRGSVFSEDTVNLSLKKRLEGTPEQNRAMAIRSLAAAILRQRRAK